MFKFYVNAICKVCQYDYDTQEYYRVFEGSVGECKTYIENCNLKVANDPSVLNGFRFICY